MLNREQLINEMYTRLKTGCKTDTVTVIDDSAQHVGHSGHNGAGHFTVNIVSAEFSDKSLVKRHQMVYQALGSYVGQEIHALCINAKTPDEI